VAGDVESEQGKERTEEPIGVLERFVAVGR
jgi:hypothetical protein